MLPMLSREVVEGEQRVAIPDQALNRLVVFDPPDLDKSLEGGKRILPGLGCGADDDQQALCRVLETGLHVNTVDPEVDVAFSREVAFAPARVLFGPGLLEATNGRGREPTGVPAEQCDQRVLEVAGRDALEVENRDQHL